MQIQTEDAGLTLGEVLRRTALRLPNKVAILWEDRSITFRALDLEVNRVANGFAAAGIKPGDPVGLLVNKRPELVITFLACARMGAVATPINFKYTTDRIRYQFQHINMRAVIVDPALREVFDAIQDLLPDPGQVFFLSDPAQEKAALSRVYATWEGLESFPDTDPPYHAKADDVVYLNYTSGSTGRPKGALSTHANIMWNCLSNLATFDMFEDDIYTGMFSTFSHPHELFHRSIYLGCTAVLVDSLSPRIVGKAIEKFKITYMMAVPSFYEMLFHQAGNLDLSSLRTLEAGGALIDARTLLEMEAAFKTQLMPVWGCTEANGVGLALLPGSDRKPGTIGKPCEFYEIRVVDDDGNDVAPGVVGELAIRGPAVSSGYINQPEETAAAFRDGWYYTQDLVSRDEDGFVTFVARRSEMLKIGGIRVYPIEIETAIKAHLEVATVVVVRAEEKLRGEIARAIVVRKPGTGLSEKELRAHCRKTLAVYQVPRVIEFWEALPQLPNGKIDKKAIIATPVNF